jgi:hypothetical protein
MKLLLEDGTEFDKLTAQIITDALAKLDGDMNNYAILLESDDLYMQTAREERGLFALEYHDADGKHYESDVLVTLAQVAEAFKKYAIGDSSYLRDFRWKQMPETSDL